jgi:hypothetical protein
MLSMYGKPIGYVILDVNNINSSFLLNIDQQLQI